MVQYVKENVVRISSPGCWTLAGTLMVTVAMFLLAVLADRSLPVPLTRAAPKNQFIAEIAYEHLLNFTSIGPRVAGTYENEVLGVRVVTEALRGIAAAAAPHNAVDIDLQRASGNFSLAFFDGLNNVYQDVQNVVGRVRARGGRAERRPALLLNCHIDSVPDSPGASDDAAGCAVALEVFRALAAGPRPLPYHVLLLANGAEENIMQGSHAFVTQHRWARNVRTFINMEACGAGGREVLFQAGPRDPWLMEEYARSVPHPFASSLAQELFESGLIPSDTDFRIFRDFGNLSGVDLAWSSNGYVYHTALDDATRVPPATLQRTGDNVLALVTGLLWGGGGQLESAVEERSRQPVFFDVAGLAVVTAGPALAAAATAATLLLVALRLALAQRHARRTLGMSSGRYYAVVCRSGAALAASGVSGVLAASCVGALVRALGAPLAWYARPWLLGPLYLAPALAASAATCLLLRTRGRCQPRAASDAACALWALALSVAAALGLRAAFLPLPWALFGAIADLAATAAGADGRGRRWWWWWWRGVGACPPLVQWWGAALGALGTLLPLAGRAGRPPLPPDAAAGALLAAAALPAAGWLAPLLFVLPRARIAPLVYAGVATCVCACAYASWGGAGGAYSSERPQRVMALRVTRTEHAPLRPDAPPLADQHFYWLPELDDNTAATVQQMGVKHAAWRGAVDAHDDASCARWPYCGAPYFLPVLRLVPHALRIPIAAPPPPPPEPLRVRVTRARVTAARCRLQLHVAGPSHVVVVVSPVRGGHVEGAIPAHPWGERNTYFYTLFAGRQANSTRSLDLLIHLPDEQTSGIDDEGWERAEVASVMVAGHWMGDRRSADHEALFEPLVNAAVTGHAAHVHLYRV